MMSVEKQPNKNIRREMRMNTYYNCKIYPEKASVGVGQKVYTGQIQKFHMSCCGIGWH